MIGLLVIAGLIGIGAAVTPIYTVAGALATAFAVIAVRNFAAGVAVFTVLTFLEQIPAISGSGLTLTKFGGGVLTVVWLLTMSTEHRAGHRQRQLWDKLACACICRGRRTGLVVPHDSLGHQRYHGGIDRTPVRPKRPSDIHSLCGAPSPV